MARRLGPLDERLFPAPPAAVEVGEVVGLLKAEIWPLEGHALGRALGPAVEAVAAPHVVGVVRVGTELKEDAVVLARFSRSHYKERFPLNRLVLLPVRPKEHLVIAR